MVGRLCHRSDSTRTTGVRDRGSPSRQRGHRVTGSPLKITYRPLPVERPGVPRAPDRTFSQATGTSARRAGACALRVGLHGGRSAYFEALLTEHGEIPRQRPPDA